jgi:hypothetical protein
MITKLVSEMLLIASIDSSMTLTMRSNGFSPAELGNVSV